MPANRPAIAGCMLALALLLSAAVAARERARAPAPGLLEAAMAGEFALQAGQLDESARWYLGAAQAAPGDAGLAERATRIALLAGGDAEAAKALALWRQRAPDSLAMHAAALTLALRAEQVGAARTELRHLLAQPGDEGWRHALVALGSGKDPPLAARLLGEAVDQARVPDRLLAWLAFGGLAQRLDAPDIAERIVQAVIARFPDEPRVALLHASQLREGGDAEAARAILAGLGDAVATNEELRLAVAAEYDALGDQSAAARRWRAAAGRPQLSPARVAARSRRGPGALQALYEELQGDSSRPDPGRRLLLGQVAEFLEHNERRVALGTQRAGRRRTLAGAPGRRQRAARAWPWRRSLPGLRELQADAAADDDARRDAYLLEAELRQRDDDAAAELAAFARGLAAFPDDPALLYSRALAWERRDDIARAEADFRRILVAEPDDVATLNALGYTLADRTTRYEEALALIDRARVAEPDNAAIIDSYGWVLYRLGRYQEALVQLRRAYALQKDPEIASHLAEVLWVTGDQPQARRYFEEARKLDPDNRALQRALEKTGA